MLSIDTSKRFIIIREDHDNVMETAFEKLSKVQEQQDHETKLKTKRVCSQNEEKPGKTEEVNDNQGPRAACL